MSWGQGGCVHYEQEKYLLSLSSTGATFKFHKRLPGISVTISIKGWRYRQTCRRGCFWKAKRDEVNFSNGK